MADDPIRAGRKRRRVTTKDRRPSPAKPAANDLFPERAPIKARFTHVIAQVASAVARSFPLAKIIETVLEQSVQTIGASVAYVMLADEKRRELHLVGHRNLPKDFADSLSSISFDAPLLTARAASTGKVQVQSAAETEPSDLTLTRELLWSRDCCETLVAIPLLARGHLVGVQALGLSEHHAFTAEEETALHDCAEVFAFAISNANMYEEERRLRALFEAVGKASLAIAGELELSPILQHIVDEARRVADAEYAALGVATSADRPFEPWVFSGFTKDQVEAIGRHPHPVGVLGIVALEGRTIRVPDVQRAPGFLGLPPHHPNISSFLGVAIPHMERTGGNLYLANKRGAAEFSEEDERAVELLAAHASTAVRQATLRVELETQRARFTGIMKNAPYGVVFVEAETKHLIANPRALALTGTESVPTLDSFQGEICTPDGRPLPPEQRLVRRVLRGEPIETQELLIRRADGREVPVLASAAPVFHRDGRIDGAVVAFEDISKLKELQRLREEWSSIVTHDLRQPLNVITMNVDMLREVAEKGDPELLLKGLERTRKASHTLNRMISDLTDVSRIESRGLKVSLQPVRLDALARDAVERQRAAAPDRTIVVQSDGDIPQIEADPLRLAQVLGNFLENAQKYADPGSEVRVEVRRDATEVRVLVSNRAPGIPAADLPKIFDRFYRSASARTSGQTGLGLGLYIAKGLIDAHGGRIWAESQPGGITTFQFALPLEQASKAG